VVLEFTRLAIGLLLAYFHRQIADFIMEHERSLVILCRQRGLPVPAAPSTETGRNIYFCLGIFIVVFELARIWLALHGMVAV
jgi:hypothetical protein